MLKALIFDLDGVIVDSEPMHFESNRRTFRDYGLEISPEDLQAYVGSAATKMWGDFKERFCIPDSVEDIVDREAQHTLALIREKPLDAIPGIRELLRDAEKMSIPAAVASSSSRRFIDAVLKSIGIQGSFAAIVSAAELPRSKPDPAIFLKAAAELCVKPESCLVIEDAALGVQAAKAAGMLCVGFANPNSGNQDLHLADSIVTDIRQIRLEDYTKAKTERGGKAMKDIGEFRYDGKRTLELAQLKPDYTGSFDSKADAASKLKENIECLVEEHAKLYAQGTYSLLIILQAMDAAGKDGAVAHIMSGLNPQGTEVYSFKQPSAEDLSHDYLWRANKRLPERGRIGIFNRSYYEEVLVVRVHDLIGNEKIPQEFTGDIWDRRYKQINHYEEYLRENGIIPLKFFLHISKDEQKERLLERIEDKAKNWKFSEADIKERQYWDEYQRCYEEMINATGTHHSPWYVIPADKKWFARLAISQVIVQTLKSLDLKYPELGPDQLALLDKYRKILTEDSNA